MRYQLEGNRFLGKLHPNLARVRAGGRTDQRVPWNADTRTPQFNPLEKLPILICDDGTSVYESRFINEWIEFKHPDPPLVPRDVDGILAIKRFEILAEGVCDALVLLFFEKSRGAAIVTERRYLLATTSGNQCDLGRSIKATWRPP